MAVQRKALGRGLSALIPETPRPAQRSSDFFLCPIEQVHPQPNQPRRYFDGERLDDLAASLRQQGMMQPLLVRPDGDGRYVLIAGERRWRAAQKAGLQEVPVLIRKVDDLHAFEMALVENLQREDLNPIEEAQAYARLVEQHGYTQEQLAARIGKQRSTVANCLRLLNLPDSGKVALIDGRLSSGHGRALLGLDEPTGDGSPASRALSPADRARRFDHVLHDVLGKGLSVRQTEALVRRLQQQEHYGEGQAAHPAAALSVNARDVQERLARSLGARVKLMPRANGSGRIEIGYGSLDELERLLDVLIR